MNKTVDVAWIDLAGEESLLNQYKPDTSVYFSNSKLELLAKPPFANLLSTGFECVSNQVNASLDYAASLGLNEAIVIGAIPFDIQQPNTLQICCHVERSEKKSITYTPLNLGEYQLKEVPTKENFKYTINKALSCFSEKGVEESLEKVVLSRTLRVSCERSPSVNDLVKNLSAKNEQGFIFSMQSPYGQLSKGSAILIGASPELLISKKGNKITLNPLAGSEARCDDREEDIAISQKLLQSEKDLREHAIVVDAIQQALKPFCKSMKIPPSPSLMHTSTMWHLSTEIEAELFDEKTSSLELALALHPTPAIGGHPAKAAKQFIEETEFHERGLFTGLVGWMDVNGDGEWAVTIRCAEIEGNSMTLYAGAGVVKGSNPEKEYNETGAKFNTLLQAIGLQKQH